VAAAPVENNEPVPVLRPTTVPVAVAAAELVEATPDAEAPGVDVPGGVRLIEEIDMPAATHSSL